MSLPQHIAIIPDGNRRWAKEKHVPTFMGHRRGAKAIEDILDAGVKAGVFSMTVWGCSIDNVTKREAKEVNFLYALFEQHFKRLLKNKIVHKKEVRIRFLGAWKKYFPPSCQQVMLEVEEATKKYDKHNLTFLLAYSGVEEMTQAVQKIAAKKAKQPDFAITSETIKQHLYTKDLPPVDLVIRTGSEGDPHFSSGFMMLDVADSQLYFTKTLWPDFDPKEFERVLAGFGKTERRLGK
jgi:undecaprenyl diphosphate synthase